MNCSELTNDKLIDYLKSGMPAEIAVHLSSCPACRRRLDEIGGIDSALAGLLAKNETGVPCSADDAVRREIVRISTSSQTQKKSFWWIAATAIAACLAVGIGLTLIIKLTDLRQAQNDIASLMETKSGLEQAVADKNTAIDMQEKLVSELQDQSQKNIKTLRNEVSELADVLKEKEQLLTEELLESKAKAELLISETRRLNESLEEKDRIMDELRQANAVLEENGRKRDELLRQSMGIIQQMDVLKQQIALLEEKLGLTSALVGDVNSDGVINIADAQIIANYIIQQKNPEDLKQFDLNKDGKVDVADTMLIAKMILER